METTEPVIAMSGEAFTKQEARLAIMFGHLLEWIGFFENDFENDEDQTYSRMKSYLESIQTVANHSPNRVGPYRERMIRRVKERMSEVKI